MHQTKTFITMILKYAVIPIFAFILLELPALAVSNTNPMVNDPGRYFPTCTCQVAFLAFVLWMVAILVIAMFQYGEKRERKLTAYGFSIIAIILAFIIYSIPLWGLVWLLKPQSFPINEATGKYEFSLYGEQESATMALRGSYTPEELQKNILQSRTGIIISWAILSVVCVGAMASIPALLKLQAERKKQAAQFRRTKRKSKGRIGTRVIKSKDEKDKKDKKK